MGNCQIRSELVQQMPEIAKLLGISRATAYNIMKRP
ncbi:TPA: helix-turn-helix domain-containing protein [Vibrio vulnificus]|nr:helix-turn-helix domain-containing protein [Vibrio vulnificus]